MPNQSTVPKPWEQSVGGVSERAGAKAGGSDLSATLSFASRNGGRHPGLPEGDVLRGTSSERRPRSVRALSWVSPRARASRRQQRMSEGRRGGERRPHAPSSACTRRMREPHSFGDASFARSGGPCTSILTMHRGVSLGGGAVDPASRLGKPTQVGGTSTGVGRTDVARLAAWHSLHQERPCHVEKRKEIEVSVPARIKSPGQVARTSRHVAEIDRRSLVSNTLGICAPKRAARVE
jgi:hypothetical protein